MVEVIGCMNGLAQAGLRAHHRFKKHLTTQLDKQLVIVILVYIVMNPVIAFTSVVDDFGIKFVDEINDKRLIDCLNDMYS